MFKTPVLLLIFNRPETTVQVFEQIKKIKPSRFFIAADGPRKEIDGELELCQKSRDIINRIDWECEVKTLFRDENLGCGKAVSEALDWFFEQNEMGIILEDDCFPDETFFTFCETLLDKYKDDSKISTIGASNYQLNNTINESYYFSIYTHIWGWASWRRVWKLYKFNINTHDKEIINNSFKTNKEKNYWNSIYQKMEKETKPNTWDYQLQYINFKYNMLSIIPAVNLVKNIGFYDGTHLVENIPEYHFKITHGQIHTIKHPETIKRDYKADLYFYENMLSLGKPSSIQRAKKIIYTAYQSIFK